jgi:putative oxidoreductase
MAVHGWSKLQDIPGLIENFKGMGFPSPDILAYLAIAGEFGGGLGLILGFLTPIAALGVFSTMAVAVFHVHWKNGLLAKDGGFEYPLTLMLVAFFFVMHGAGPISLDALFCRKKAPAM